VKVTPAYDELFNSEVFQIKKYKIIMSYLTWL